MRAGEEQQRSLSGDGKGLEQPRRARNELHRWDARLVALSREDAALRLRLGQVLEVLHEKGHCFALGFSSSSAFALERCDRSARWLESSRHLAQRLEALPLLRRALALGELTWSAAELVVRVARGEDEATWLSIASRHTVRELHQLVRSARRKQAEETLEPSHGERQPAEAEADDGTDSPVDAPCTLTVSVDREDAWLFESTRALLDRLGAHGTDQQIEALLGEAQDNLLAHLPRGTVDPDVWDRIDATEQRWREQLHQWRDEAERRCEAHFRDLPRAPVPIGAVSRAAISGSASLQRSSARDLDQAVRHLSQSLARHELVLSRCLLAFHRADGWRRLGYATESQYARERLGLSRSSLVARRALAARLETLPALARALGAAKVGVEAALQLVRIATPRTEEAWIQRAQRRTVKHLREEVAAALTAVRHSDETDCPPPEEAEIKAFAELERAVLSGRICQPAAPAVLRPCVLAPERPERRAWQRMLGSLATFLDSGGIQLSAGARRSSVGRVVLKLRVARSTFRWWRGLEAQAGRFLRGMSWLRFLCLCVWRAWRHLLGAEQAYGGIYLRDGYRCRSPVCNRRDVTAHHLRFRSRGGGDEPENVATVCSWCHLFGIHGGRIRAEGTAEHIRWELGPTGEPCLVVDGRDRLAA